MSSNKDRRDARGGEREKRQAARQRTISSCLAYSHKQQSQSSSPLHAISDNLIPLPWILEQILREKIKERLPLRMMFSFNAGYQVPTLKQARAWWGDSEKGKKLIQFITQWEENPYKLKDSAARMQAIREIEQKSKTKGKGHHPDDKYMCGSMPSQIAQDLRQSYKNDICQNQTLPVFFCKKAIYQAFPADYGDFLYGMALSGLDYLREIEVTRRCALRDAANRLGITAANWIDVLWEAPEARYWVENVQNQEINAEIIYGNIYLDIRLWTMVKQLQEYQWDKYECVALLNTLYPPLVQGMPNEEIREPVLHDHRKLLYRCMQEVEASTSRSDADNILERNIVSNLTKPDSGHSWLDVRENIQHYIELADLMIKQAETVSDPVSGGIKFFLGHEEDSLHTRTESNVLSEYSERPVTVSSANTSIYENTLKKRSGETNIYNDVEVRNELRGANQSPLKQLGWVESDLEVLGDPKHTNEAGGAALDRDSRPLPRPSFHSFSRPSTPGLEARRMQGETNSKPSTSVVVDPRTLSTVSTFSESEPAHVDIHQIPTAISSSSQQLSQNRSTGGDRSVISGEKRKPSLSFWKRRNSKSSEHEPAEDNMQAFTPDLRQMTPKTFPENPLKLSTAINSEDKFPKRDKQTSTKSPAVKSPFGFVKKTPTVRNLEFIDGKSMFLDDDDDIPQVPLLSGLGLLSAKTFTDIWKKTPKLPNDGFPVPVLKKKPSGKDLRKIKSQTSLHDKSITRDLLAEDRKRASGSFDLGQRPGVARMNSNTVITSSDIKEPFPFRGRFFKRAASFVSTKDMPDSEIPSLPNGMQAVDMDRYSWSAEGTTEFELMSHSRKWSIANARSAKSGVVRPPGEPEVADMETSRGPLTHRFVPSSKQPGFDLDQFPNVPKNTKAKNSKSEKKKPSNSSMISDHRTPDIPSVPVKKEELQFVVDPKFAHESFVSPNLAKASFDTPRVSGNDKNVEKNESKRTQSLKFVVNPKFAHESFVSSPNFAKGSLDTPWLNNENKDIEKKDTMSKETDLKRKKSLKFAVNPKFANESFVSSPNFAKGSIDTPRLDNDFRRIAKNFEFKKTDLERTETLKFAVDPKFANESFVSSPNFAKGGFDSPRLSNERKGFEKKDTEKRKTLIFETDPKFRNESFSPIVPQIDKHGLATQSSTKIEDSNLKFTKPRYHAPSRRGSKNDYENEDVSPLSNSALGITLRAKKENVIAPPSRLPTRIPTLPPRGSALPNEIFKNVSTIASDSFRKGSVESSNCSSIGGVSSSSDDEDENVSARDQIRELTPIQALKYPSCR